MAPISFDQEGPGTATDEPLLVGVPAAPLQMLELAEVNVPGLVDAINAYAQALERYVPALRTAASHPALIAVGVVGINDFNDLLFDCLTGRGRSAARASRTLFEHLLNLVDLENDEMRDRFITHYVVGVESAARWNPVATFIKGKALKALRHRQRTLARDNRRELDLAIAKYGQSFIRRWHPDTVRQRATRAGLEREYDFFRSSSDAVHGAASAIEGSFWIVDYEPLVRVGPSVIRCPAALAAGIQFFRRFIDTLESYLVLATESLSPRVHAMGAHIEHFCEYTNGLDQYLFQSDGIERPARQPEVLRFRE